MSQKLEANHSSSFQNSSPSQGTSSVEKLGKGKWSKQQHLEFLKHYEVVGKDWKKIAQIMLIRTQSQVRSHAQKYFNKKERMSTEIGKCERDLRLREGKSNYFIQLNEAYSKE